MNCCNAPHAPNSGAEQLLPEDGATNPLDDTTRRLVHEALEAIDFEKLGITVVAQSGIVRSSIKPD